jgi:hypothetical protein
VELLRGVNSNALPSSVLATTPSWAGPFLALEIPSAYQPSDLTPASDQVVYQDDHRDHYQDVNQVSTEVTNEAQQPQDQQYHYYCPQH